MLNYKLLALDLDGTLLDQEGQISQASREAVRRAWRAGAQVALCTGRNLADTRRLAAALALPRVWAVTANGADVRQMEGKKPAVSQDGLDGPLCQGILDACCRHGSEPCLYTNELIYYGTEFQYFVREIRRRMGGDGGIAREGYQYVAAREWEDAVSKENGRFTKAILYHRDPDAVDAVTGELAAAGLFELAPSVMFGGQLKNVEINRRGVHKGRALASLSQYLGIRMEEVMAIGDSDNDLTMLRMAGMGVAMGNAPGHIRAAANALTASNTEEGVALAVRQYLLE